MKKILLSISLILCVGSLQAQVLNMPQVIQEQDQWCWAGVTKSVLAYYGVNRNQCEIAEYAREVITWGDYGSVDCCTDSSQGCNYWNYNWGYPGSIQDILLHFGNIHNNGTGALSLAAATAEVTAGRPFIVRWGWTTGGGHFVVGHGVSGNNVYYMNPWFGEGSHVSTYNWLVNDGSHTWTHTNKITTNPLAATAFDRAESLSIFPNPTDGAFAVKSATVLNKIIISDALGKEILQIEPNALTANLVLTDYQVGIYFVRLFSGDQQTVRKLILK